MIEEDLGDKLDDLGRRLFNVVCESSQKMGRLIDDLLAFSRLVRQPMNASAVNMFALANESWREIAATLPKDAHDLRVHALPVAQGDRGLLKQVWMNLLSNAAKYTSKVAHPVIEVSGQQSGRELVYCVRDNGAGFDMRNYGKLFGVFQRLHAERDFPGNGVGLAIVQRIITRHGGRVWAEGKVNAGAAFFFTLPAQIS
jgi:light-regulated signal transduction histidine kinase (bacteriophytochrome)